MKMNLNLKISLLESSHNRTGFNCGKELLDHYIKQQAGQDVRRKLSVCFVLSNEDREVKGYYTLSNSSIPRHEIPEKFIRRLPGSYANIPVTLLGRLAVDRSVSGKGFGEYLLMDALRESYRVSKYTIGSMAIIVDPIDDQGASFYEKYGFIRLPGNGKMFLPMNAVPKLFPDI